MDSEAYKQWKAALDDLKGCVEKSLEEVRLSKEAVQRAKLEVIDRLNTGRYMRDENRIIISAPEVIIGNVDMSGTLISNNSVVTLRSGKILNEGVGSSTGVGGVIENRAGTIRNICCDPGTDGTEAFVGPDSKFVVQAGGIALDASSDQGCFSSEPSSASGCINLSADSVLNVSAALPCENRKKEVEDSISSLKDRKKELSSESSTLRTDLDKIFEDLDKALNGNDKLFEDEESTRSNYQDLDEINEQVEDLSKALSQMVAQYTAALSELAETNRRLSCLEDRKKELDKLKSKYKENSTNAAVNISAENINLTSIDDDGNQRTNPGAGIGLTANDIRLAACAYDASLMEKGSVSIDAMDVRISTTNPKIEKDKGDYPAAGNVVVRSKNVLVESVDYELKDKKVSEKALTKDGAIKLRAEKFEFSANDTEGKASGELAFNAKSIELKSMDVDKEKRTDSKLAEGSTMQLLSEKIFAGRRDKENTSKNVQIASDKLGLFADTTAEIQQGEAKAVVQLDGGKLSAGGDKTEIYGETTMQGKAEFKGEVKAPKAAIDNLEVKSSFKTPYTTEGMAMGAGGGGSKISAKLKVEDAPKKEK